MALDVLEPAFVEGREGHKLVVLPVDRKLAFDTLHIPDPEASADENGPEGRVDLSRLSFERIFRLGGVLLRFGPDWLHADGEFTRRPDGPVIGDFRNDLAVLSDITAGPIAAAEVVFLNVIPAGF